MIKVRVSTRSGQVAAMVWAIIAPIDMPATCTRSISRWSRSPIPSAAMSRSR